MVEYLEDQIEENPNERFAPEALATGEIMPSTGDRVVDQWERDLAAGKQPDFTAGLDEETAARVRKLDQAAASVGIKVDSNDEVRDTYTTGGIDGV